MENIIEIAGIEFIKFPATAEGVPVVAKNLQKTMVFGDNNDFRSSKVLRWLKEDFLPKIAAAVGEENLISFETDLITLDGLESYGVMESKICIPTLDFYRNRENAAIFRQFPAKNWWWLATPDSCKPNDDPNWILRVAPSGRIDHDFYNFNSGGVRPMLMLRSSI